MTNGICIDQMKIPFQSKTLQIAIAVVSVAVTAEKIVWYLLDFIEGKIQPLNLGQKRNIKALNGSNLIMGQIQFDQ